MTQKDRILEYLKSGKTLTRWIGLMDLSIWETPARISELKSDGHKITTKIIPSIDRNGKVCHIAEWTWIE